MSPFELAIGLQPRVSLEVVKKKVGQVNPTAHRLARTWQETLEEA